MSLPLAEITSRLYAMRRRRDRTFGDLVGAFRESAWDMIPDLFMAATEDRPVAKTSFAFPSVQATGLRWVDATVRKDLLKLAPDASDGCRSLIELTRATLAAMSAYLSDVRASLYIGDG